MSRRIKIKPEQIEKWIKRNFPEAKKRSNGRQISINNPFNGDTGQHFWISLVETKTKKFDTKNYYVHDWRNSSYNMSFVKFVKRYLNVSYFEAIRDITDNSKNSLRDLLRNSRHVEVEEDVEEEIEEEVKLPVTSEPFKDEDTKVSRMALNYLESRRISKTQAISHNLHYTPSSIVFPYIEYGVIVYWQERSFIGKIFNFPNEAETGLRKTDYLYNFDNVEQPDNVVIIVEAIISSINIGDGCVATGGATMADDSKQLDKICGFRPKQVIFAPDLDKAGVKSTLSNYLILKKRINASFGLALPPEKNIDWNDIEKKDGEGAARKYIINNSMKFDMQYLFGVIEALQ